MDVAIHQLAEGLVHETLRSDPRQTAKPIRYHEQLKVSATGLPASVIFVEGALINDRDVPCVQLFGENVFDFPRTTKLFHHLPLLARHFSLNNAIRPADLP
jgi:hypothetical protein